MRECLEFGIMRCDESRASGFQKVVENGTRQRRALLRISPRAQFNENHKRAMINLFQDANDVHDVTTERAERLLDGLLIADIGINRLEVWKFRATLCGDMQSTLRHERKQTDCF